MALLKSSSNAGRRRAPTSLGSFFPHADPGQSWGDENTRSGFWGSKIAIFDKKGVCLGQTTAAPRIYTFLTERFI